LIQKGADSLSDAELIAILLRTGLKGQNVISLAQDIIKKFNGIGSLATKTLESLVTINGIGKDKAATLLAAFELGRRSCKSDNVILNKQVIEPSIVAEFFIPLLKDEQQETFWVVCLNSANKIINYQRITVGILNSVIIHPREVFKIAIENNAASIILLHNHPSGNSSPSEDDRYITKRMKETGKIVGIEVFDHLIISGNDFFSFVQKNEF